MARFVQSLREPELEVAPLGTRDRRTVDPATRERLPASIEGVRLHRLSPHVDHRGSLTEVINLELPFWDEPVTYAYRFTIRPGRIKGWGMHKRQADRYLAAAGRVRVVLFDGRVRSRTQGNFDEFHFDETAPGLLYIPPGVWHADQNTGDRDAVLINFPTRPYEPADPDKYRIDPHSGEIPFDWQLRDG